jgi:ATP-binding cassette subfamily C protein
MSGWRVFLGLLRQAPPLATAGLLTLMCLVSLSEGIGIIMLAPLLDTVRQTSRLHPLPWEEGFAWVGLEPTLGAILGVFLALVLLRSVLLYLQQIYAARYQHSLVDRLRMRCYSALLGAEWHWLSSQRTSYLASSVISGSGRVGAGLNQAIASCASLVTFIACLAAALVVNWRAALVAMLCGALGLIALAGHRRRSLAIGRELGLASRTMHANLDEGLSGIRVIKMRNAENSIAAAFAGALTRLRHQQNQFIATVGATRFLLQAGSAVVIAGLVYAGVNWWQVSLASLIALTVAFARLVPLAGAMQQQMQHWLHAVPALVDLEELLSEAARAAEPAEAAAPVPLRFENEIALERVSVFYAGERRMALDALSVAVPARGVVAIIGASGAGKSSLADVLAGLVEPDSGSLLVDGKPVSGPARRAWRGAVAYVEQEAFLFHDSIRNNLLFACPGASEAELKTALHNACADFVFDFAEGIDTVVDDRGARLSGGERQRIALARALLIQPALIILYEARSALDLASESAIIAVLAKLRDRMAIVMIGHRPAMIEIADTVVLLEAGRIAWTGRPAELRDRTGIAA